MNKYLSVIVYDLKNTRRDPTLLLLLWMPIFLLFAIRFGLPALESYLPDVSNYSLEIVGFFALLNSVRSILGKRSHLFENKRATFKPFKKTF